ncbi:hypothetical protein RND81_04G145900 [Saponaria officinalis]|uniref:Uncharacterized protein n=1 Tax=Saponaria officinalis TaxID=3572 RepID=A0AAW1LHN6_SAPOF
MSVTFQSSRGGVSEDTESSNSPTTSSTCYPKKGKAGRKKFKKTHPIYHGISHRNDVQLETYPITELAARVSDVPVLALKGEQVGLNFPKSSGRLAPQSESTSPMYIRPNLHPPSSFDGGCNMGEEKTGSLECPTGLFLDEEAAFNMPVLINSMAEGMLLTPPALKKGVHWDEIDGNELDSYIDLDLWQ